MLCTCTKSCTYCVVFNPSYLIEFITSGPVVALELKGSNVIEKWKTSLGPTDSATARIKAPISVRAKFGTGTNCI